MLVPKTVSGWQSHLMASTAMRVGATAYRFKEDMASVLEFGDLTWVPKYNLYKIMVYNRSKGSRYPTYCTPECASLINRYLDYRRECGEIIKETSPLIREQFDPQHKLTSFQPQKNTGNNTDQSFACSRQEGAR